MGKSAEKAEIVRRLRDSVWCLSVVKKSNSFYASHSKYGNLDHQQCAILKMNDRQDEEIRSIGKKAEQAWCIHIV